MTMNNKTFKRHKALQPLRQGRIIKAYYILEIRTGLCQGISYRRIKTT